MSGNNEQLLSWLSSVGVSQQFSRQDIEAGRTVASILKVMGTQGKVLLQDGNSAITRVNNWNIITEHLKQIGVKLSQQEKGNIINGNHDLVFKVISKLRDIHQRSSKQTEINLKDVDPKKDVRDAESLLELFLLAIIKHFGLSPKEALSLLSNDCKYLAHILAKGLKGDFRPIEALILQFSRNIQKIATFAKNKQNQLFFLKSIKPALISKSESVAESSLALVVSFLQGYELQNRVSVVREHLVPTLMLIIRRHQQLSDEVVGQTTRLCDFQEGVVSEMIQNINKNQVWVLFISIWRALVQVGRKEMMTESPSMLSMVDLLAAGFQDPQMVLGSLRCSLEVMDTDFQQFDNLFAEKLMMAVRYILPSKQSQNLELVHIYFCLVERTGQEKHPLAPIIYKLLVSRLHHAGDNQYEVLMNCFTKLLDELTSIPASPLIEILSQRAELKIQQLEIELFGRMLVGIEARGAVAIFNLVSRSFVEESGLGRQLALLLVRVVGGFREEEILIDMTGKLIKVCLALYFASAKKLAQKRKPLSYKTKMDPEEVSARIKMLEIQFFLKRMLELQLQQINSGAEALLCFSCIQLSALGKQQARGLEKVVALLGDTSKLLAKYQKEMQLVDQPQKKSRVKHHSPSPEAIGSPDLEGNTSEDVSNYDKSPTRRLGHPLHPMSLSLVAVKTDAYVGLQKYAKRHQVKAMAEESKRYQVLQAVDDKIKQKKVMQRKVAAEKGIKIKGLNQTQVSHIFEFNSKDIYAESNNLDLNFYSPEAEEERDAQGVQQAIRRYQKVLKVYFKDYCGKKGGFHAKNFDEALQKANHIHTSGVFKLLKDHGMESYITPKELKMLSRKINYRMNTTKDDPQLLDFEGFKKMVTQMSFVMFTRPPKDLRGKPVAEMLEQLFSMFKLYASENRISPQMFEDPQACFKGEQAAVRMLNQRLLQNPDYILPEGYKKITQTRMVFDHKIYLQAMSPTYKEVYEVLDQILFEGLKIHAIEPSTQQLKVCRARPNVYALEWNKLNEFETKHMPITYKKQVAKFPIYDRPVAKEAALTVADIIRAVQLNHDEVGLKHDNPYIKGRKDKQQDLRRLKQEAETKRLNATRQLRSAIDTYKDKKDQKVKKIQEEKDQELRKKKQHQAKKQRREKELKQKLEEYGQKKKQDQEAKKVADAQKKEREKVEAERKRKEMEETRKKIDERKREKQEEQKKRAQEQEQEKKKRKDAEKKRMQRDQYQKKQKIEEYKSRKKGDISKVMDAPEQQKEGQEQN